MKKNKSLIDRTGEKFKVLNDYEIEIIEYFGNRDCTIKFNDEKSTTVYNVSYIQIKRGQVKNPNHPSVFSVGYFGIGKYRSREKDGDKTQSYKTWVAMLNRCYNNKYQEKHPTYVGCSVDERWHNFQVFGKWFEENFKEGFDLDKDLLFKHNKVYSPETCCFIPQEINKLFTKSNKTRGQYPIGVSFNKEFKLFGAYLRKDSTQSFLGYFKTPEEAFQAYKKAKEKEIKSIAKFCKYILQGRVYQAMINYKVEITD